MITYVVLEYNGGSLSIYCIITCMWIVLTFTFVSQTCLSCVIFICFCTIKLQFCLLYHRYRICYLISTFPNFSSLTSQSVCSQIAQNFNAHVRSQFNEVRVQKTILKKISKKKKVTKKKEKQLNLM